MAVALDVDIIFGDVLRGPVDSSQDIRPSRLNLLANQPSTHLLYQLQLHEEALIRSNRPLLQYLLRNLIRFDQKGLHKKKTMLFIIISFIIQFLRQYRAILIRFWLI